MEETEKVEYSDLLLKGMVFTIVVAAIALILLPNKRLDIILITLGVFMGLLAVFYLYHSFSAPPRELILPAGENVIKKNVEGKYYVILPMAEGGFIGKTAPVNVNLYLTNKALIAESTDLSAFEQSNQYYVLSIPLATIVNFKAEKKFLAEYIRLAFTNTEGFRQEMLIHTGSETNEWVQAISETLST